MKMAKATSKDLDAAIDLAGVIENVCQGYFPSNADADDDDPTFFDPDDQGHLKAFYDRVMAIVKPAPGALHRVSGGMHTVLHNDIADPDDDVLSLHPRLVAALEAVETLAEIRAALTFQQRVQPWMLECFGSEIAADMSERCHRLFEESGEACQSKGMTRSEAHQLVDYTWDRPIGGPDQEVGGVMVTLAAFCLAAGIDMHAAGESELARINVPETVAKIRAKQAAKPKHSPLPATSARLTDDEVIEKSLRAVYGSCFTEQDVVFARTLVSTARGQE
ncbi:hypothetical protein PQR39_26355 [Paraburkholderia sediminicola]|uniref:hypothetical protein n=1 Tax=Paraburkholderia sediminicola TaxID=458836 RepID=UPI0038B8DCC2